jgi:formylglycine-generating enzyme required for sulfatase activity
MTLIRANQAKTAFVLLCGAALIVLGVGAVSVLRSPAPVFYPDLQAISVVMEQGRRLNVQTREVTVAQWQACHDAGHCQLRLSAGGKVSDYPATGISYEDAMQYVGWINTLSDREWRLPSAAEWRELALEVMPEKPDPIFTDPSLTWASTYLTAANQTGRALRPSGAFSATSAGIEDLDGNVWEWTQDCYAGSSGQGAMIDTSQCPAFIMGGEHEAIMSYLVRDPARGGCAVGAPPAHLGMRLVSDT